MATAPFPFCYSPPYAYSSAAAYPPTTSGSFPAPAYAPYSFPFFTAPSFFSSTFPYAAAFPAPASGFSQNWPPPSPDSTTSMGPSTFSTTTTTTSSTPTSGCVRFSPPPPTETSDTAPPHLPDLIPRAPLPSGNSSPTAPSQEHNPPQSLVNHGHTGRVEVQQYASERPRTTAKSRALCTGEKGVEKSSSHAHRVSPDSICQEGDFTKGNDVDGVSISREKFTRKDMISGILSKSKADSDHSIGTHQANTATTTAPSLAPTFVDPKVLGEMPQRYGFHNLNRQTVFRADGTKHSYFALPENYPLELATPETVPAVYYDESDDYSTESVHVCTSTPEQLTDKEEQHDDRQASKCFSKPIFSLERPTVGPVRVFSFTDEQKPDTELVVVCVNKTSDNGKAPQVNNRQLNKLIPQAVRKEWDPGASLTFISSKIEHPGQALQLATHATTLAFSSVSSFSGCKCLVFCSQNNICVYWASENGMTTYFSWDPGVLRIKDTMLDKCVVLHQVQFIQQTTELSILILEAYIQYYASNGVNSVMYGTSFVLQKAKHSSADNYFCSLHCQTEYCQMRCLWKLPISGMEHVQWDPGVQLSLDSWLDILTVWSGTVKPLSCTHTADLAAWPNQFVGRSASYIWDPGTILWYTFIWLVVFTVSDNVYAYCLAVRHSNGRSIHYTEKVMCYFMVSSVLEEKEMLTRSCSSIFQPIQFAAYCNALSFQQYSHQDVNLYGIPLWLINFQVP